MIEQHIGHFEKVLNYETCNYLIDRFYFFNERGLSFGRKSTEGGNANKKDQTVFLLEQPEEIIFSESDLSLESIFDPLWNCFGQYVNEYPALQKSLDNDNVRLYIRHTRLQKTEPGEGYHVWHYEADGIENTRRIVAWSIFLNNVMEGGETEFLHQHKRYNAREGDLLMWPATYTHTHRGNTPLSNTKYILTGWIEY